MPVHEHNPVAIYGEGFERCPVTDRPFEVGSGALPKDQQTANYIAAAAYAADLPKPGEICARTGKTFEIGHGCQTKTMQTARFLRELSPDSSDSE
jgi:hypothetical protein